MGTVHQLRACTPWCTTTHTSGEHEDPADAACTLVIPAGTKASVLLTHVSGDPTSISLVGTKSSYVEDLRPEEAELVATKMVAAALMVRGEA
jgi:hypothetical protein